MLVNHSFDYHFVQLLEKLQKKYGEDMFKLQGIARENLDISRFTNKFLQTKTTADISVDANANVDDMSILSWNYEMPKPLAKLNALYHLWKDALKKHGIKRANKMIQLEIAGGIRIHDLHGWLLPYSYSGNTEIYISNNKDQLTDAVSIANLNTSMQELFEKYENEKQILPDREIVDLTLKDVYVLDGNGKFTKVTQCLKHKRDTKMFNFKVSGRCLDKSFKLLANLTVTANHPMIMEDGSELNAELVKIGDKLKGVTTSFANSDDMTVIEIVEVNDSDYDYVYDITTESHTFYSGFLTVHNCWSASLAPIVNDGMPWVKNIKVKPVKHFDTLISNSVKYIYNLSTQCVGAIAVPDFLAYAEYFIRKDYGEEWYNDPKAVRAVRQGFQNWIYGINDKARGNQSPFTNVSIFDKYWREAMFGKHTNPDFSLCNLDNLKRTQRMFIDVLIEQQEDNPFTFPVMTGCQLKDKETGEIMDKDWLDWISGISVKNKLINFYTSDSVDSLSSCLFKGNMITVINKNTNVSETIDISEFVTRFIDNDKTDKDVNISDYMMEAYNVMTGEKELVDIKSVIKRSNKSGLKVTISTGDEEISVSPDHIIAIRNSQTGQIKEITANELVNIDYSKFQIAVSD